MPKAALVAAPSGRPALAGEEKHAYAHTLSLRLTREQYRRLRRFVVDHEDRTDRRLTHQAVLEAALAEYLDRNGRLSG